MHLKINFFKCNSGNIVIAFLDKIVNFKEKKVSF